MSCKFGLAFLWEPFYKYVTTVHVPGSERDMNAIHFNKVDYFEFGSLIQNCRDFLYKKAIYLVRYVKRHVNEATHILTRSFRFYTCSMFSYDISKCLNNIVFNYCSIEAHLYYLFQKQKKNFSEKKKWYRVHQEWVIHICSFLTIL